VKKTSPGERVLTVTVPAERVEAAYQQAFNDRRKGLKLKGFRKGNVPLKIAEKHIRDSHLVQQVVNLLVPSAYREAVSREELQPLGKPEWKLKQSERGGDLVFEATIQVMPLLELDGYKGQSFVKPAVVISDEQVEEILERRRQGVARNLDPQAPIKDHDLPHLDDAFAREHCNAESLVKLRERIRRNLESQGKTRIEEEIVNQIVSGLASGIDLGVVPPQLQEGHARLALRNQTLSLERQGQSLEQWLAGRGISMEHFSEELNLTGLVEARLEILYRSLAAILELSVSNKEVDEAIINQARENRTSARDLKRKLIEEDAYKLLAYRLLIAKIRMRLLKLAEVKFVTDETKPKAASKKPKKAAKKKKAGKKKAGAKKSKRSSKAKR